ncbi:WbuC family cupin fold metalloprotein [Bacteroides sp. B1-V-101]
MNWNLHESFEGSVQRMFNAIESGSKIPIARHPNLSETLIILRGRLRVLINERY